MKLKILLQLTIRSLVNLILTLLLGVISLWSAGDIYYNLAGTLGMVLFLAAALLLIIGAWKKRFFWYILGAAELLIICHFVTLTPARQFKNTQWQKPWGRAPQVVVTGDLANIRDIRNFKYRSTEDYKVEYFDASYDISQVQSVDVVLSHWDGLQKIAHTMLSFGFSDGRYLALSMETRLPEGVEQGFLPGLYKQYGILMILATEEDLFKLRTNYRQEELYLYRTNATPGQAQQMFRMVLENAAELYRKPQFYNSITQNCTTSLAPLLRMINPQFTGDIRLLLNGNSDELLYDLGYLQHRDKESFAELKARRKVDQYLTCPVTDYSAAIRQNL